MKIIPLILISFLTGTAVSYSQTKSLFIKPSEKIPMTLFDVKVDSANIASIQILGKIAFKKFPNAYNTNVLPQRYSWTADLRKAESLNNMLRETRIQDDNGRDLPTNIHQEVIQRVYLSSHLN